jgi:hypothetical protein
MWSAPHIEGQYLRDRITSIVIFASKASNPGAKDWFNQVYELLDKHQIPCDWRVQFYTHAQGVHDACHRQKDEVPADSDGVRGP